MLSRALRTGSLILVAAAAGTAACGHLPFDDLPVAESGLGTPDATAGDAFVADVTVRVDSGGGGDDDGGSVVVDGAPPLDDASGVDATTEADACTICSSAQLVFVTQLGGDDANDGTVLAPVKTIQRALELVTAARAEIRVAVGPEAYDGPIELKPNVSLLGGYSCDLTPTAVRPCDWTVATGNRAQLRAGATNAAPVVTTADGSLIQNFAINGPTAQKPVLTKDSRIVAVHVAGGRARFVDCDVTFAKETPFKAPLWAIQIDGPAADADAVSFERGLVRAGDSTKESIGVRILPGAAPVRLSGAILGAGSAPTSYGVFAAGTDGSGGTVVTGCTIDAAAVGDGRSWAIGADSTFMNLDSNLINTQSHGHNTLFCTSNEDCGGVSIASASARLVNNVVWGLPAVHSAALLLAMGKVPQDVVVNSNFFGAAGVFGATKRSAGLALASTDQNTFGNVQNNIFLGSDTVDSWGIYEEDRVALAVYRKNALGSTVGGGSAKFFAYHEADGSGTDKTVDSQNYPYACTLDAAYHLVVPSGCKGNGTSAEPAPKLDRENDARPATQYDIGPDQTAP